MKPVIAMPRMENSLLRCYMIYKYRQSLRRAGATVKRFPLRTLEKNMDALLRCDGLLMPGGADIQPHLYGHSGRHHAQGAPEHEAVGVHRHLHCGRDDGFAGFHLR